MPTEVVSSTGGGARSRQRSSDEVAEDLLAPGQSRTGTAFFASDVVVWQRRAGAGHSVSRAGPAADRARGMAVPGPCHGGLSSRSNPAPKLRRQVFTHPNVPQTKAQDRSAFSHADFLGDVRGLFPISECKQHRHERDQEVR